LTPWNNCQSDYQHQHKKRLKIEVDVDPSDYKTGIKVSDDEMAHLNNIRNAFHGEWNYKIIPQETLNFMT